VVWGREVFIIVGRGGGVGWGSYGLELGVRGGGGGGGTS